MNNHMLRAILCGGVMIGLAAASIILQSLVHVPLATEYGTMCLTAPSRLIWWDRVRAGGQKADQSVYELETGKLKMLSFRQCPWKTSLLPGGRYVGLQPRGTSATLCVMDCETLETIRESKLPLMFRRELLNQRYLVTDRSGTMFVCDVLAEDPSQLRSLPLTGWHPWAQTKLYLVGGSNLVVAVSASPKTRQTSLPNPPNTTAPTADVHVYQIDEESIQLVASWISGYAGSGISRQGDKLLSLSPDGSTLESRDLSSFELVRSEPLPKAMMDGLPSAQFKHDLCEIYDPRSQQGTIFRLDTLRELANGRVLTTVDRGIFALDRSDSSYRLLYSQLSSVQFRIAVYDMERDKLVWDRIYSDGCYAAELLDDNQLLVAHSRCGITAEIIDLKTAQIVKTVRPYAWLLPGYVLWAIALTSAAFGWIYYSARTGLSLPTSILILAAVIVPVPVYALTLHGTAINVARLATSYSLAILLSASAGAIWIALSQLQNRTMRFTYQLAVLSIIAIALAALSGQDAFPKKWLLPAALLIASVAALASLIGLMVLRCLGYRTQWLNGEQYALSNPTLWQFFAFTAACSAMLVACMPFRFIPWQFPKHIEQVAAFAVPVAIPYLFVFLLLKMSDSWFHRWTIVAAAVAALLVLDFIGAFVRPHQFTVGIVAANLRICVAGFVITFLWLWAFRLRGCSIAKST